MSGSLSSDDASMLRLHRICALCLWCLLLVGGPAVADEEAHWGVTPSRETQPKNKPSSFWWTPSLPKLPSLPSLPFHIPFYSQSGSSDGAGEAAPTTPAPGLLESIDPLQENSGSGEGSVPDASDPPSTSAQRLVTAVTAREAASLPPGTLDSPHSSTTHRDALVSVTLIRNAPLSSTGAPRRNETHTTRPPRTTQTSGPRTGATAAQHPDREGATRLQKISLTTEPETTVPTALTAAVAPTTTADPGLSRHTAGPPHTPSETTFVTTTQHPADATVTQTHPIHPGVGWEERARGTTVTTGGDHKLLLGSTESTSRSLKVTKSADRGEQTSTDRYRWDGHDRRGGAYTGRCQGVDTRFELIDASSDKVNVAAEYKSYYFYFNCRPSFI